MCKNYNIYQGFTNLIFYGSMKIENQKGRTGYEKNCGNMLRKLL